MGGRESGANKAKEEARNVLAEVGWHRSDSKGRRTMKFDDEEDYESGLFVFGNLTIRYVHPINEMRRVSITKRFVRFFTLKGGIIIEDQLVDIENLEKIEELAREGLGEEQKSKEETAAP